MNDKYDEMAREALGGATTAQSHRAYEFQVANVASALRQVEREMLEWTDDDKPLPEDEQIDAAFPTRTGRHDLYAEAMRMVGAKRSKGALVALVNWLLSLSPTPTEDVSTEGELIDGYVRVPILLDCPFCGADGETIDPHGWQDGDGKFGPQCLDCGATAESYENWNRRAAP